MKLIYFFLILGFTSINVYSKDNCLKLSNKECKKDNKCRWSKPNKSCISNYTASNSTKPTDLYSTKGGTNTDSRIKCDTFTSNDDCSKRSYCLWVESLNKCNVNPNQPIEQSSSSHQTFTEEDLMGPSKNAESTQKKTEKTMEQPKNPNSKKEEK